MKPNLRRGNISGILLLTMSLKAKSGRTAEWDHCRFRSRLKKLMNVGLPDPWWMQIGMSTSLAASYTGKKYGLSNVRLPSIPLKKTPAAPFSFAQRISFTESSVDRRGGMATHLIRSLALAQAC